MVLNRVTHKLCIRPHAHLLEDSRAIRAYGLVAQREKLPNLADGFSGGNQAHHFEFTIGETFMERTAGVPLDVDNESFGQGGAYVPPPSATLFTASTSSARELSLVM